jgi:hypothetical protein
MSDYDYALWLLRAKDARLHELDLFEPEVRADRRLSSFQRVDVLAKLAARRAEIEALRQGAALADDDRLPSTVPGPRHAPGTPFSDAHPPAGTSIPPSDNSPPPPAARPSRLTDILNIILPSENMSEKETQKGEGGNDALMDAAKVVIARTNEERALIPSTTPGAPPGGIITAQDADRIIEAYEQFERIKGALFVKDKHYVMIQGRAHIKKEGAYVLAARFGVAVRELSRNLVTDDAGKVQRAEVTTVARWGERESPPCVGICERSEATSPTDHNIVTKAETRSYKRSVLLVLGSADPIADEE